MGSVLPHLWGSLLLIRIQIQHFKHPDPESVPNPDRGFWWPKIWRNTTKIFFLSSFYQKFQFTYPYGRPGYRRSLWPSKENIQHFKRWNLITAFCFCGSLVPSWIRIQSYNTGEDNVDFFMCHVEGDDETDAGPDGSVGREHPGRVCRGPGRQHCQVTYYLPGWLPKTCTDTHWFGTDPDPAF